ncbi:Hypothetical predicted protein [Paramuricea clavata]|uniref:Uncharacterized protein n=1 Tax=Paramuricea clavata TaxID=317549 RepID=A0A6S7K267_PARCT|nr:Hypothetical predicted protein [Paramuricea clavata]
MAKGVSQWIDCVIECVQQPCCRSINYKKVFQNEPNCEILHDVVYNTSEKVLERNSFYDYVYLVDPQKEYNASCFLAGTSCLDIKNKGLSQGDGKYLIDSDGESKGNPFEVYCDMTSFGGGWTMCYTTDSHVNIKTELTTTLAQGYRADCNNIPASLLYILLIFYQLQIIISRDLQNKLYLISILFQFTGVIFVDEATKEKAAFNKSGLAVTFSGNYNKKADVFGLWTAQGVASADYQYQMLICDTGFYKGLHFSGYIDGCFKECNNWCNDRSSPYFRTSAHKRYQGVAFNENGHTQTSKRAIRAGIR